MSCDWDVHCVTCGEDVTDFSDANHREDLVRHLIRHASLIATLGPLLETGDVELKTYYGPIAPAAFAKHLGHELRPRNEYGGFDDSCGERFTCSACEYPHTCVREKGHAPPHSRVRRPIDGGSP